MQGEHLVDTGHQEQTQHPFRVAADDELAAECEENPPGARGDGVGDGDAQRTHRGQVELATNFDLGPAVGAGAAGGVRAAASADPLGGERSAGDCEKTEAGVTFVVLPDGRPGRTLRSRTGRPRRAPAEGGETTVDLWTEAFEEMDAIDPKQLNLEQRLRRAEVKALLVIAQELVALREGRPST